MLKFEIFYGGMLVEPVVALPIGYSLIQVTGTDDTDISTAGKRDFLKIILQVNAFGNIKLNFICVWIYIFTIDSTMEPMQIQIDS